MRKLAIFGVAAAMLFLFTPAAPAQNADEVVQLRRENDLLKNENDLLKKENELLKKEIELLKKEVASKAGSDGKANGDAKQGGMKATIDDVEYELVSLKRNGVKCEVRIAVTSKKGSKRPAGFDPSVARLYTADGTEFIARGVTSVGGVGAGGLRPGDSYTEGVRVVKLLEIQGELPNDVKEFVAIRIGRGFQGIQGQPVNLKGSFSVEER